MWIYRIKYTKQGVIRFISHLDTMRALKRALRRATLPVAYSEGFNPRPKMSMGPALPLGHESVCELADITLTRELPPAVLHQRLEAAMPDGLTLLEADLVAPTSPRLSRASSICYVIELSEDEDSDNASFLVREFNNKDTVPVERVRQNKKSVVDVRKFAKEVVIIEENGSRFLSFEVSLGERGTCSPAEVTRAVLGISQEEVKCLRVMRTEIKFEGRL